MKTENRSMKTITGLAASLALFGFIGAVQANPIPLTIGNVITAQGGDVTITFISMDAADTDLTFLAPVHTSTIYFNNKTAIPNVTNTFDLGTFAAGTMLTFGLTNEATHETFYTGPGANNTGTDGKVYADVHIIGLDETYVGFEDLSTADGSDWDYNDLEFSVTYSAEYRREYRTCSGRIFYIVIVLE